MKNVLILVLSSDASPYDKMLQTAQETWDSIDVPNCETIFYCAESEKKDTDKIIYLPIDGGLKSVSRKTMLALEWAYNNKKFDYVARVHSSIYVDKKKLIEFVQTLPDKNVFAGAVGKSQNGFDFVWGGVGYLISRDVVWGMIYNKPLWQYAYMEDEVMSLVVAHLGIKFTTYNRACSIDKFGDEWMCISYCNNSKTFKDFSEVKDLGHCYYRVKCDKDRSVDEIVMRELFKHLQ